MSDLPYVYFGEYKSKVSKVNRNVELVVELVPKTMRQKVTECAIFNMKRQGYDLVDSSCKAPGDMIFHFIQNRIIDWNKYHELENEWYEERAKNYATRFNVSVEVAMNRVRHPYLGISPPDDLLEQCTTHLD